MAGGIETRRLTQDDTTLATQLFALMAEVFEEGPRAALGTAYVDSLLRRPDFWAVAAFIDGELAGGLTAHTLPMTRGECPCRSPSPWSSHDNLSTG